MAAAAVFSVCELFILTKFMGRRQISQLSFFDYIIGISIGSIAAEMAFEDFESIWKQALAMVIYSLIAIFLSFIGDKSIKLRRIIEGESLTLIDNGKILKENFKKTRLDINEFMTQCRINGFFSPYDIQYAIMEPNGTITFLPKSQKRPVCPEDLKIDTEPTSVPLVVVSDGNIIYKNLNHLGKEEKWLRKKLKEMHYPAANDIFLALFDGNNLIVFENKK